MMENLKQRLIEIRNNLYDSMPKGQIDAFELTIVIANHLKELDSFIDNECEGNAQQNIESKCNNHYVIPDVVKSVCPSCKGSGEVQQTDIDWDECRKCNGTGQIVL